MLRIIRALLGMSRALVALFVLAHAGLAAILATGEIPTISMIFIGALACISGTGALIGLNDLLDIDLDRRRFLSGPEQAEDDLSPSAPVAPVAADGAVAESRGFDIGSLFIHHPVARGILSMRAGVAWVAFLSVLSLFFIYRLKPALWPIFFAVAVFVILYSVLGMRTYWKFMAVAMAVTLGAAAGWLTVADSVSPAFWIFAVWTFLWEIGGRNVPNDFNDVEEDLALGVKTIPVILGPVAASRIVMVTLAISFALSFPLFIVADMPVPFMIAAAVAGIYLLLIPASALWRDPRPEISQRLYNKSAVYPVVLLVLLMANLWQIQYL